MCPPTYFDIEYEINPWMRKDNQVIPKRAAKQWQNLHDIYTRKLGWDVQIIEPVKGLPDMVFATDNCVVIDDKVLLSHFRFPERRPETEQYEKYLQQNGFSQVKRSNPYLEGGDVLPYGDKIIAGYGFRSDRAAHDKLANYFNREVISLRIVDPYFYHLDAAVAVLNQTTAIFYPGAIDPPSQQLLKLLVPNLIEANLEEARTFGLNVVSNGQTVIFSDHSPTLAQKYRAAGFEAIGIPISEFQKSGGGVKCLTLELRC